MSVTFFRYYVCKKWHDVLNDAVLTKQGQTLISVGIFLSLSLLHL